MNNTLAIIFLALVIQSCSGKIPTESNGQIEVEAENFSAQTQDDLRKWVIVRDRHAATASGGAYVECLPDTRVTHDDKLIAGENFSNVAGQMAVLSYPVNVQTTGRYYVWVRAYSTGSEDNGIHVGLDGQWPESGQRMQWCEGKNAWTWESKQRTEKVHCGEPYLIYLDIDTPGRHLIQFSMREDGFEFDKFLLTRDKNFKAFSATAWQDLFDGKTFDGWTKYLGRPQTTSAVPGMAKDANGRYTGNLGVDNDPLNVYSIVREDGQPAIRVSGEVFGTLLFNQNFENYHVRVDFKWGEKKWPPREDQPRDAGLLYHGSGEQGSVENNWHLSQECQIQEGDAGDYWPVGNVTIDIPAIKTDTSEFWAYRPKAPLRTNFFSREMSERRILKYPDNEKPHGQWNTAEVITWGDSSVHIINGKVVMRLYNSRKIVDGKSVPLRSGKIALQSEGAELFYRNVQVRQVTALPQELHLD
ncbi:family 16 glycoside hydrolase [Persicitalea jodogahamensis]|uniref:3-keto-disaccharide hydrolase domain-containing protein n=1 Tax=Persicitalea jodogahamensis TaxID=402147 RepID=A0A8J3G9C6_9BACT|nr:family 16 glycoside hydrolase [Persicitalea jodogahamensis]GHB62245.1 hypothetical protein GCM10007390_15030 [Persicitalea jodogahamensis]